MEDKDMLDCTNFADQSDSVIHIDNATNHHVIGHVEYTKQMNAGADSNSAGEGQACFVTEISAIVKVGGDEVAAIPFTSIGTTCREFSVVEIDEGYAVTQKTIAI